MDWSWSTAARLFPRIFFLFHHRAKISKRSEGTTRCGIRTHRRGTRLSTNRTFWGHFGRGLKPRRSCSRCANNKSLAFRIEDKVLPGPPLRFQRAVSPYFVACNRTQAVRNIGCCCRESSCPNFDVVNTCATFHSNAVLPQSRMVPPKPSCRDPRKFGDTFRTQTHVKLLWRCRLQKFCVLGTLDEPWAAACVVVVFVFT